MFLHTRCFLRFLHVMLFVLWLRIFEQTYVFFFSNSNMIILLFYSLSNLIFSMWFIFFSHYLTLKNVFVTFWWSTFLTRMMKSIDVSSYSLFSSLFTCHIIWKLLLSYSCWIKNRRIKSRMKNIKRENKTISFSRLIFLIRLLIRRLIIMSSTSKFDQSTKDTTINTIDTLIHLYMMLITNLSFNYKRIN